MRRNIDNGAAGLRIVLVAFTCDPTRGSEPAIGWGWTESLARRGHTVEVLTHPDEFDSVRHAERRVADLGEVGERIKLHVIPEPRAPKWTRLLPGPLSGMAAEVKRYDRWQRRALAYARGHGLDRADLVHHVSYGSLQGGSALRHLGPPLVFGPVGGGQIAPHSHRRYLGAAYPREALRTWLWVRCLSRRQSCRMTLRDAALVLATNRDTERRARDVSRATRLMLADGIQESLIREPAEAPPARSDRPPTVLWVGRLHPRKTPELAVRAVAHLRSEIPDARLVVLGDGPLRSSLEQLALRLGVGGSVEFRGLLPREEVFAACDEADAFLMTSLRDSSSTQTLEAWARGLPVVHLGHHGISDFSAPGGAVSVPLGDPSDLPQRLAWALGGVLKDQHTRHCMERAALAWARKHTWSAKAETAEELYRAILPPRAGG